MARLDEVGDLLRVTSAGGEVFAEDGYEWMVVVAVAFAKNGDEPRGVMFAGTFLGISAVSLLLYFNEDLFPSYEVLDTGFWLDPQRAVTIVAHEKFTKLFRLLRDAVEVRVKDFPGDGDELRFGQDEGAVVSRLTGSL